MTMQELGIILVNLVVIALIALIFVYLVQDRRRFRVERQYRAVKPLLDEWVRLAGALPGCAEAAERYARTGNISQKYRLTAALAAETGGRRTARMAELGDRLAPFCHIYMALAEPYNRALMGRVQGPVLRLLRFRELPRLDLGSDA